MGLSPAEVVPGGILLGALFGAGWVATRRFLPRSEIVSGSLYGAGCFVALESLNRAMPPRHQLQQRVFREPGTSLVSLITAGAAVAWFARLKP